MSSQANTQKQTLTLTRRNGRFHIPASQLQEIEVQLPRSLAGSGVRLVFEATDHSVTLGIGQIPARDTLGVYPVGELSRLFQIPKLVGGIEAASKRRSNVENVLLTYFLNATDNEKVGRPNFRPEVITEMTQIFDSLEKLEQNMILLALRSDQAKDGDMLAVLQLMEKRIYQMLARRAGEVFYADRAHVPLGEDLLASAIPKFIYDKLTKEKIQSDVSQTIVGIFWSRNAANGPVLSGAEIEADMQSIIGRFATASSASFNLYAEHELFVDPDETETARDQAVLESKLDTFGYPLLSPEPIKRRVAMKYEGRIAPSDGPDADLRTLTDMRTYILAAHYFKSMPGCPSRPFYAAIGGIPLTANMNMTVASSVQEWSAHDANTAPLEAFDADHTTRIFAAVAVLNGQPSPITVDPNIQVALGAAAIPAAPGVPVYRWGDDVISQSVPFKTFLDGPHLVPLFPSAKFDKEILPSIAGSTKCKSLVLGLAKDREFGALANVALNHLASYSCPPIRDAACTQFSQSVDYLRTRRFISETDSATINDASEATALFRTVNSSTTEVDADFAELLSM